MAAKTTMAKLSKAKLVFEKLLMNSIAAQRF
jgi:hypothetical protein